MPPITPEDAGLSFYQLRTEGFALWMLWGSQAGDSTWYWGLEPLDEQHTRLITRVRMRYNWTSPRLLFALLVEFADIVMMRKCRLGIKRRVERVLAGTKP